jgi:HAD superfamily hydrolase (TIGR01549 family)
VSLPFKAVVFDAFGTLVQPVPRNGAYATVLSKAKDARLARYSALTLDLPINDLAHHLGLSAVAAETIAALEEETRSVQLFEDTLNTIDALQAEGVHVSVCSNLAHAYGEPVRRLLPSIKDFIFSYEVGRVKPEPAIYGKVRAMTGFDGRDTLFIGDTPKADVDGPEAFGMWAQLIRRPIGEKLGDILERAISER